MFSRVYQRGEDGARTKREVCAEMGLLVRHYSGCRADAIAAVKGWRERLKEQRIHLRTCLAALEARREKDWEKRETRRRNAVATRKAETRLARVEEELRGRPRHCFGGRKLLRQGRLAEWRRRRDGNALFAGETGKAYGNEVARWNPETRRLEVKPPGGLRRVVLDGVRFASKIEEDLRACVEARTPVSWRIRLLARGKVELAVTYEEPEAVVCTDPTRGALALAFNAEHIAATLVSGDGQLLDTWRWDLRPDNDNVQNAARLLTLLAARARCARGRRRPRLPEEKGVVQAIRKALCQDALALAVPAGDERGRAPVPKARGRAHRGGPGLDHEDSQTRQIPRPVPDRTASRRGARYRATRSWVCRAGAEDGLAPRARRCEAPGYARLGEHARAMAARRQAHGWSAWRQQQAGGPCGSCREGNLVVSPARWASGRHCKSGCRWPGGDSCPHSRLSCNG